MLYFSRANRGSFSSHITVEDMSAKATTACVVRASMEVVADTKRRAQGKSSSSDAGGTEGAAKGAGAVKEGAGPEEREALIDIWGLGF